MNTPDPSTLETVVQSAVANLADRQAPRSLEARVLAEIRRRSSLPWWQKSLSHWPVPMRAGFFVGSAVAAALAVLSLSQAALPSVVSRSIESRASSLVALGSAGETLARSLAHSLQAVPPVWLYGSAAIIAGCYLCLVGLGAAAYKTFRSSL